MALILPQLLSVSEKSMLLGKTSPVVSLETHETIVVQEKKPESSLKYGLKITPKMENPDDSSFISGLKKLSNLKSATMSHVIVIVTLITLLP